ncbi:uroporphyrinogen III methyltransferase / synthase [Dehalogenimonas formicexedens]|uniref:uroporphyrinogen-III C-methyltransferase n=1 Tax=Dehalogenimonas formicexedens TaxID=1839801 RepID=A0A1P8F9G5_9CHLR|nr:uroporphyrinogen-III C-methyltransferase [Dehalogenimonas formicexedens]APV45104.1 uroporphyrinogen III methyltransferase / synthase [Dehalogenimonas formicexedens]
MEIGKVYLLGAGPGDPGLITVKAAGILEKAEVIVYDRLASDRLLKNCRPDAELIYVGKAAADHALPQDKINQLLVDKALEGKTVARLKGGDPFVFGRGGEEAETLAVAGVPFEVVPGVSSSVAVPAYAGIPVTHRAAASSFAVVTGHEDPTKAESRLDWTKFGADTLVILMGTTNLPNIVAGLRAAGRAAATPAAVIEKGTTPEQRVITGTLADIVAKANAAEVKPPAILVVGEVVNLRHRLAWFDNRPLFGKKVLVTRSRTQASELSAVLCELGAVPLELPVISITTGDDAGLDRAIGDDTNFDWVVFTSANGVEAFFTRLAAACKDARWFGGGKVAAIGPATAASLECRGIRPDLMPAEYTAEAVLSEFAESDITGKRFLLPRADIAPPLLAEGLRRKGAVVVEIAAYRTLGDSGTTPEQAAKSVAKADIITFCSSSTVEHLLKLVPVSKISENIIIACIGPVTAATAEKLGLRVDVVAAEHTIPGLVDAMEEYLESRTSQ